VLVRAAGRERGACATAARRSAISSPRSSPAARRRSSRPRSSPPITRAMPSPSTSPPAQSSASSRRR